MPNWSNAPPADNPGYPLRIVRTSHLKPLIAIVTSLDVVGCCTHFVRNRTVPCEGTDTCKWCQDGFSWRWHGYLTCIVAETLEHVLFEFTAAASESFKNYNLVHQQIRGCHFKASRPSGKHNGRVIIACKPSDPQRTPIPPPPDIKAILCHIWNVKNNGASVAGTLKPPARQLHVTPSEDDGRYAPTG